MKDVAVFNWVGGWAGYPCSHCYLCQHLLCVLPGWIYPELSLYYALVEREPRYQCSSPRFGWTESFPHSFVPTHLPCKVPKTLQNQMKIGVRSFMPGGVAVIPIQPLLHLGLAAESGGSIPDARFKKLGAAREARRLQQTTGWAGGEMQLCVLLP